MSTSSIIGPKWSRIIYTGCIFFNYIAFGMSANILWPALPDFCYIYNVNSSMIQLFGLFTSLGYLIGSLSGLLYKWINRQITQIFMVAMMSITVAFAPFYGIIGLAFVALTLNGIGNGSWDLSATIWLVEMWPDINATMMQICQFMYGLGTMIGPLIIAPYVIGENNSTRPNVTVNERKDSLAVPFFIDGAFQGVVSILLLIMFMVSRYVKPDPAKDQTNIVNGSDNDDDSNEKPPEKPPTRYRRIKWLLSAIVIGCYNAAEIGYFFYSPSMFQYLEKPYDWTATEAAHLATILSASYTVGRLVSSFIVLKVVPDIIIMCHCCIITASLTAMYIGIHNRTIIYVSTVILGYGYSAMWSSILAFTERHLKLSDLSGSLMFFIAGTASLTTPLLSNLKEKPMLLFLFELAELSTTIILFIIVKILVTFWP